MTKIDANIYFDMNGKRITCIKMMREIFDLGLAEAKNLVEKYNFTERRYRMNEGQFGTLMLVQNEIATALSDDYYFGLTLRVSQIKRVREVTVDFDFSESNGDQHPLLKRPTI